MKSVNIGLRFTSSFFAEWQNLWELSHDLSIGIQIRPSKGVIQLHVESMWDK